MDILENTIKSNKPSVSLNELKKYELVKAKMESDGSEKPVERKRIGFKP